LSLKRHGILLPVPPLERIKAAANKGGALYPQMSEMGIAEKAERS
jgi:hypothetical protein